jgi:hypothetical protein
MAKKKSEKSEGKAESKPAAKKAAPVKKQAAAASGASHGTPAVDTNLAAQAAARMLAANAHAKQAQPQSQQPQQKSETSLFKQMKAGLNKPASSAMGGLLDKSGGPLQKKPNQPFGGKQVGHNQTFGADVTRSGVPRRTSGG